MKESYFQWLLNRAGVSDGDSGYVYLCSIMHEIEFYARHGMDENWCQNGIRYRWDYADEKEGVGTQASDLTAGYLDDCLGGCTVLELVLSLAENIAYETQDSLYSAGVGKWFEELISNLGLDLYTNRELMENEHAYFEAEGIIQRFVYRQYAWNGEGGLFPLRAPMEDQRFVELSIQMNNYIAENYDVLG